LPRSSLFIEAEKEEHCSYRYLIYSVLDAGRGSYVPLQLAGLLEFHNEFYENPDFMSDYKKDFSQKEVFEDLSEDDKIALISYVIHKNYVV